MKLFFPFLDKDNTSYHWKILLRTTSKPTESVFKEKKNPTQQVRALAAFQEDLGLNPSTHIHDRSRLSVTPVP